MPTNYTSDIYRGEKVTFEGFALHCAKAFCLHEIIKDNWKGPRLKDPDIEYLFRDIKETKKKKIKTKSEFEVFKVERIAELKDALEKTNVSQKRYEDMLEKVNAWSPPSQEYNELKNFMIAELERSIKEDCSKEICDWYKQHIEKWQNTKYSDYVKTTKEKKKQRIAGNLQAIKEEKKETATINQWIKGLYKSLKQPIPNEND